MIVLDYYIVSS